MLAAHRTAIIEHDAIPGLFTRNAPVPARRPVSQRGINKPVTIGIRETGGQRQDCVRPVGHGPKRRRFERAAAVRQDEIALLIGRQEEVLEAVIVDIHKRRVEDRQRR